MFYLIKRTLRSFNGNLRQTHSAHALKLFFSSVDNKFDDWRQSSFTRRVCPVSRSSRCYQVQWIDTIELRTLKGKAFKTRTTMWSKGFQGNIALMVKEKCSPNISFHKFLEIVSVLLYIARQEFTAYDLHFPCWLQFAQKLCSLASRDCDCCYRHYYCCCTIFEFGNGRWNSPVYN